MIKQWKVIAQMGLDANNIKNVIVRANTERKARIIAKRDFEKQGGNYINIVSVKEIN